VTLVAVAASEEGDRVWFRGEKSLVRPIRTYFAEQGCRGSASQSEEWLLTAVVEPPSQEMSLQYGFTTSDEKGEGVCNTRGYVSRMELNPSIFGPEIVDPIVMALDSGTTKQETADDLDNRARETLLVRVLGTPGR